MLQRVRWSRHRYEMMFLIITKHVWSIALNIFAFLASRIFQRMIRSAEFEKEEGRLVGSSVVQMLLKGPAKGMILFLLLPNSGCQQALKEEVIDCCLRYTC